MTNLIIGCGYLGSRVAALWRERGDRVLATTRQPAQADVFRKQGIEPLVCDVLDPATLTNLPQVDTVAYAIGLDRTSGQTMHDVYVQGLRNVLERLPTPKRFVYVSSSSVYGQA